MLKEIDYISDKNRVTVCSLKDFKKILQKHKINDNNVEKYIGKYAFIEIGSGSNNIQALKTTFPKNGYDKNNWRDFYEKEQWGFNFEHPNVLHLEFDDVCTLKPLKNGEWQHINTNSKEEGVPQDKTSPFKSRQGFKYQNISLFTREKANKLNKFIENNIKQNKNIKFIIHCHQGTSRSFAIGTYITKLLTNDKELENFWNEYTQPNKETGFNKSQFRFGKTRKGNPSYGHSSSLDLLGDLNNWNKNYYKELMNNFTEKNQISKYKKDIDRWSQNKIAETVRNVIKEYINEDVAVNQLDNQYKVANLTYNTSGIKNNLKKSDYLKTDLMDKTSNAQTFEVPLKGGLISYNITGIKGTEVMHYFKNHFQHKDTTMKFDGDNYKLQMKENEFNQFMQVFKKKIETVIENDMLKQTQKEQKKNKDFQFSQISIYPVPSSSNFNEKMAQELSHLTINFNQKSYKINILNKNILLKDLKNITTDRDFIKANKNYYYNTSLGKDVDYNNMYHTPAISHINTVINKNKIIFREISKLINEINKIYFQIYNIVNTPNFNSDTLASLINTYFQKYSLLIKRDSFMYDDERYHTTKQTNIMSKYRYQIDEKNDLLTPSQYTILNNIEKQYKIQHPNHLKITNIKPLLVPKFEIKNLPDSVRMGLRNIYIPNENEEMQEELNKVQSNLIVVFDDNISGGATLSDVCYQLYKLGAQHIIPITFGQMAKKTNAKDETNHNIRLNEPTNGKFNTPQFKY